MATVLNCLKLRARILLVLDIEFCGHPINQCSPDAQIKDLTCSLRVGKISLKLVMACWLMMCKMSEIYNLQAVDDMQVVYYTCSISWWVPLLFCKNFAVKFWLNGFGLGCWSSYLQKFGLRCGVWDLLTELWGCTGRFLSPALKGTLFLKLTYDVRRKKTKWLFFFFFSL